MDNIFIALENIRSLYNVGSILRSASFFGIKKILLVGYSGKLILPNGKAVLNEKLKKTALTSEMDIEIIMLDSSDSMYDFATENSLKLISIEQEQHAKPLTAENLENNVIYVLGNEVEGVSKLTITKSKRVLEIKHSTGHNSLNVATTAGILFHVIASTN